MDKKKLDAFKKRLETRQQDLRRTVSRTQADGRSALDETVLLRLLPDSGTPARGHLFCNGPKAMNIRVPLKYVNRFRDGHGRLRNYFGPRAGRPSNCRTYR